MRSADRARGGPSEAQRFDPHPARDAGARRLRWREQRRDPRPPAPRARAPVAQAREDHRLERVHRARARGVQLGAGGLPHQVPVDHGEERRGGRATTRSWPRCAGATCPTSCSPSRPTAPAPSAPPAAWIDPAALPQARQTRHQPSPKPVQTTRSRPATAARCRCSPTRTASTTTRRCSPRPGSTSPPKTVSELAADAKKLTTASRRRWTWSATDPYIVDESVPRHFGRCGAKPGRDAQGHSALAQGGQWANSDLQKSLIDFYGYDKLVRWQAGSGDKFAVVNAFERGKLAMRIDGENREAFIDKEHPELKRHRPRAGGRRPAPASTAPATSPATSWESPSRPSTRTRRGLR